MNGWYFGGIWSVLAVIFFVLAERSENNYDIFCTTLILVVTAFLIGVAYGEQNKK